MRRRKTRASHKICAFNAEESGEDAGADRGFLIDPLVLVRFSSATDTSPIGLASLRSFAAMSYLGKSSSPRDGFSSASEHVFYALFLWSSLR